MAAKVKFYNKINIRVISVLIAVFLLAGIGIIVLNYFSLKSAFEQSLTKRLLICNDLMSKLLDRDDISRYVTVLKGETEEFKASQLQFDKNREELYALELAGEDEERQEELRELMRQFHAKIEPYKDSAYDDTLELIKQLKVSSNAKYLYVFAKTGVIDDDGRELMTYIYDANDEAGSDAIDRDGLGTVIFEEHSDEIYESKKAMTEAGFYDMEPYGQLYFAYAPILDANGDVIALIGTDIDTEELYSVLSNSIFTNAIILVSLIVVMVIFIYFYLRRYLLAPVRALTETATKLAEGDVYASVPPAVINAGTEIGTLAQSIDEMGGVYRDMITGADEVFEAANAGRLEVRNDETRFKGDISRVVRQFNDTLDSTILYLNSIPESVFLVGPGCEILFKNNIFKKRFEDISGSALMGVLLFDDVQASTDSIREKLAEVLSCDEATVIKWINGACYSIVFKKIANENKSNDGVLIIAFDITDLENERIKAQAASAAKSEFLSRVSHELRTPMNVIIGMSLVGMRDESDPKTIERFKHIDAASRHLLAIINDVLDMSRIESGKMNITKAPFDLKQMLDYCQGLFANQAEVKNFDFAVEIDQNIPDAVISDEQHLKQVIINLLSNSFKFTEAGGKITLSAKLKKQTKTKADIEFTVADSGIGMSKEFMDRLFAPFEQDSAYLQRKEKGSGLGLSISKNLINLMGGEISAESEKGKGSTFKIALGCEITAAVKKTKSAAAETDETDVSGMRILLVDDIEMNRVIFAEIFGRLGLVITEADDGTDALEKFEKSTPGSFDLIFMDVQMVQMDGYEATRRIRASGKPGSDVPIIAMTANALKQDVDAALASGMNGHVAKPIEYNVCLSIMRKYFKKKQ